MAITPEGRIKAKVKAILNDYGHYHFMPATGGYGRSGVPDIIACVYGQFVAIECKAGKNSTTALQARELRRIEDNGGVAFVVNEVNLDEFREWVSKIT